MHDACRKLLIIPKNYPLVPDKCSRHAQYYKMLLLLCSLNERALGTRIKENCFKMATRKRARGAEVFYHNFERGVRLKAGKIRQKIPEKTDQENFHVIGLLA